MTRSANAPSQHHRSGPRRPRRAQPLHPRAPRTGLRRVRVLGRRRRRWLRRAVSRSSAGSLASRPRFERRRAPATCTSCTAPSSTRSPTSATPAGTTSSPASSLGAALGLASVADELGVRVTPLRHAVGGGWRRQDRPLQRRLLRRRPPRAHGAPILRASDSTRSVSRSITST